MALATAVREKRAAYEFVAKITRLGKKEIEELGKTLLSLSIEQEH